MFLLAVQAARSSRREDRESREREREQSGRPHA